MSVSDAWNFSFEGRGLPAAMAEAFDALNDAGNSVSGSRDRLGPEALESLDWPEGPYGKRLREITYCCLASDAAQFNPPFGDSDEFYWRAGVCLHERLAWGGGELFFAWLCQFAQRDQFFGTGFTLGGFSPTLFYTIDRAFVTAKFDTNRRGELSAALAPGAVKASLDEGANSLEPTQIKLRRYSWREISA